MATEGGGGTVGPDGPGGPDRAGSGDPTPAVPTPVVPPTQATPVAPGVAEAGGGRSATLSQRFLLLVGAVLVVLGLGAGVAIGAAVWAGDSAPGPLVRFPVGPGARFAPGGMGYGPGAFGGRFAPATGGGFGQGRTGTSGGSQHTGGVTAPTPPSTSVSPGGPNAPPAAPPVTTTT